MSISFLLLVCLNVQTMAYASSGNPQQPQSGLPQAVKNVVGSAVDVEYYNANTAKVEKASGVKISPSLTISAGHEFLINGPISASANNKSCRILSIYSTGDRNLDSSTDGSIVATYSRIDTQSADVSFINTVGDKQFNELPVPSVGAKPGLGDKVYFVNYEPDSNLVDRNPNSDANTVHSKAHTLPAIYSGVIVDNTGKAYIVATGIKSYGKGIADDMSRPGASGGPVFNQSGQLIGITVSIVGGGLLSEQTVSSMYDTNFGNISPYAQLQLEEIQPITPSLISEYTNLLKNPSSSNVLAGSSTGFCNHSLAAKQNNKSYINKFITAIREKTADIIVEFKARLSV